jgi:hypothetical protein
MPRKPKKMYAFIVDPKGVIDAPLIRWLAIVEQK